MNLHSTRFGEIEVADEQVIQFTHGLPGFPQEKKFAILPGPSDTSFLYLQSAQNADLTFILLDTFAVYPEYAFQLDDAIAQELQLSAENPPVIYNIVTVPEKPEEMTVNLAAPLVINGSKGWGMQVILNDTGYSTRHRIFAAPSEGGR